MSFIILKGAHELKHEVIRFPGGEVGVKLDTDNYAFWRANGAIALIARIRSSENVLVLANLVDAIRRRTDEPIHLLLPYLPYARQDRVCVEGESFSLLVFAQLIKTMGFSKIATIDPHSSVAEGVFNGLGMELNCVTQLQVIDAFEAFTKELFDKPVIFVSPDAGANKKTADISKYFNHASFIRADKLRNLATGEIVETVVYADDLAGVTCIIADDICDGGRTFIELAKVLKAKNAARVLLYVTHGIFSKGFEPLLVTGGIDHIYTTNSYQLFDVTTPNVTVLDLATAPL